MFDKPIHITDNSFDKAVLESENAVLVDFWASWCPPCRAIAPTLEKLAGEFAGKVTIAKLNVDDYPHLAQEYGIQGIPTLIMFKNGEVVDQVVGAAPEPMLRAFVQRNV